MNETQRRRALADVKEFFLRAGALAALLLVLFGVVFGLAIQPDEENTGCPGQNGRGGEERRRCSRWCSERPC